jgi:hypothetical protein
MAGDSPSAWYRPIPMVSMLIPAGLQQIQTVGQQGLHHGEMAMSCRPHAGGPRNVAGRYYGPQRSKGIMGDTTMGI